jgi:hypothetical protein
MVFTISQEKSTIKRGTIKKFLGARLTSNILNMPLGQLVVNKNMEYIHSGKNVFLRTKRGSTLLKDITDRARGAGNYIFNLINNFLVWVDINGDLKVYDENLDTITILTTGLTTGIQNHFVMYGAETSASLYIANNTDGVGKVSGAVPAFSTIIAPNLDAMKFSTISGRIFGAIGHTICFTEIQADDLILDNLEDWKIGTNKVQVSPDDGSGFSAMAELSTAMFYFKDTGIWAHLNAPELVTDWSFPKMNSDVGTLSPKTVHPAKYGNLTGIIFLASDKTLRFLGSNIIRNAGKIPSVTNSDALIISNPFQTLLDEIPSDSLIECEGVYKDRLYILNIVGKGETELSRTIFVDTSKLLPLEKEDEIPQPFYFDSENMNYTDFVIRKPNNTLFGFNKDGYISKVLVEDVYTEGVPARININEKLTIEYKAITGWFNYFEKQAKLLYTYVHFKDIADENSFIDIFSNSFILGDNIPEFEDAHTKTVTSLTGQLLWDQFNWDQKNWSAITALESQNVDLKGRGHYFLFGIKNINHNQPIEVLGFEPEFRIQREDVVGKRL